MAKQKQYSPAQVIIRVTGCCAASADRQAAWLGEKSAELPALYAAGKGAEIRELLASIADKPAPPAEDKPRTTRAKKE